MQSDVNGLPGRRGVLTEKPKERIKRRARVRIQERVAQSRLADFAYGQVLPLVSGITETGFPVPRLEIVAKLAHLPAQSDVEELVPVSEFFAPWTGVVDTAEPNVRSHRRWYAINNQSRISNCEGIERILDWHTDTGGTKERVRARILKWIRHKRNRRQGCIEIRARILKVGKHHQVFVAQVARERTVIRLAISRRQRRRECREVKEEVVPIGIGSDRERIHIKWRSRGVRRRMSRWRLKTPLRRCQKSATTTISVLSSPVPAFNHAFHSPISLDAPRFVFP